MNFFIYFFFLSLDLKLTISEIEEAFLGFLFLQIQRILGGFPLPEI